MNTTRLLAGVALLASLSFQANAELVHSDWKTLGDAKATADIDTGIEWLKLNNTKNMSINQVMAETGKGGLFHGWRLPTSEEVQTLVETVWSQYSFNDEATATKYSSGGYRGATNTWRTWMGTTRYYLTGDGSANNRYWYSYGLHVENDGSVAMSGSYRRQKYVWGNYNHWANLHDDLNVGTTAYDQDYTHVNFGVFLVSDGGTTLSSINDPTININNPSAPVNVSAPFLMSGLGMFGLSLVRRKKQAAITTRALN